MAAAQGLCIALCHVLSLRWDARGAGQGLAVRGSLGCNLGLRAACTPGIYSSIVSVPREGVAAASRKDCWRVACVSPRRRGVTHALVSPLAHVRVAPA
jgi:hypothetical protein